MTGSVYSLYMELIEEEYDDCKVREIINLAWLDNNISKLLEPWHEISNNVVCATSKGSDQPAHMRSLIRAFASRLNLL